jgi:hypothetical protein
MRMGIRPFLVLRNAKKQDKSPTKNTPSMQGQGVENLRYHLCRRA